MSRKPKKLDQKSLEAACQAVCIFCKEGVPYDVEREQHENLYHCKAKCIRLLMVQS